MGATSIDARISLLVEYLDVCNTTLAANRNTFPYKQLFALFEKLFANRQVACMMYEDNPNLVLLTATVQLAGGKFEPVPEKEANPSLHIKLKTGYMEGVVRHRRDYIDHPEKLDWDWLKSRLGMETTGPRN